MGSRHHRIYSFYSKHNYCNVINSTALVISLSLFVCLSVFSAVINSPASTTAESICFERYEYRVFTCNVPNSNPPANVTWFRGSTEVTLDGRVGVSLSHQLVFAYMISSDVAQWKCRVTNDAASGGGGDSSSYVGEG